MSKPPGQQTDYDVLVVGSGFGGSVAALRLTEKGYRVGVLEAGRRFTDEDFATTSWDLRKYLWAPRLGCFGIQRLHLLRDVLILAGSGVGGGSLVYANTLYQPGEPFFRDKQWAHITDWRAELTPFYEQAQRMFGVISSPNMTPSDHVMKAVAEEMGVGDTFGPTPIGVFFDKPGEVSADPYFGGVGPERTGCTECGACMTGCRVGAKNTLVKNYLGLAERAGAEVLPLTTATAVQQRADGTWAVTTERTGAWARKHRRTITAQQVVLAAGTWGTQNLLFAMKDSGVLPKLSPKLGELTRTNSESIVGAGRYTVDPDRNFSTGVAITSSFHPDEMTHIEPVRYGKGSNVMGLLQTLQTDGGGRVPRWAKFLGSVARHPVLLLKMLPVKRWSERTIIALVMQNLDNSITTFTKRGLFGRKLSSRQGHGEPNPSWIPAGNDAVRRMAKQIDGIPGGTWGEIFDIPLTAHFLGGCAISDSPENGVIDPYHRVHGYPGLSIVDGAAISANLGVNPSLSITAQAERAFSLWPNKGEVDRRPSQGAPYQRLAPVAPVRPVVPADAPAALRLPLTVVNPATKTDTAVKAS
ncbi:GMC family oxidoreductase [Rhodococcus sp. X156]|uniref:FAD-dependent oxidoreductase n=1 Tax=Rhodococcus sp. X156 TaxID=2499145 RepID=UPI000FD7BF58|nr:GMC family oxidoreductase [Rhodococcus sp. X156]